MRTFSSWQWTREECCRRDQRVAGSLSYISQMEARSQCVDNVLGEVRVLWIPDQSDGNDLWTVEENPACPELLPTLTLTTRRSRCSQRSQHQAVLGTTKASYRTVAKVVHTGIPQQLTKHTGCGLPLRRQHLQSLVAEKEKEGRRWLSQASCYQCYQLISSHKEKKWSIFSKLPILYFPFIEFKFF